MDKKKAYDKEYAKRDYVKAKAKEKYKSNPENYKSNLEYMKKYFQKPKVRENERLRSARRYKDPMYRLRKCISNQMRIHLKSNGLSKGGRSWEKIVGYTKEELHNHLESFFTEGMTWENQGKWHIDHIIPVSFFKYTSTDDVEFKMCWRLENLQPLWALDNLRKNNKVVFAI